MGSPRAERLIPALLAVATLLVYAQTLGHEFVSLDDRKFVSHPRVESGLSIDGVRWAFTSTSFSTWHPLTWISHMLDRELYGLDPAGHHLTNLLLHVASVLLLYAALRRLTGETWRTGIVAWLFALHPLHVESVAWVAERKDVLSGLFWMLTLWTYARYAERPSMGRYGAVALSLCLGLMAKPMGVTLPFVLLLLDFWPLQRFRAEDGRGFHRDRLQWLLVEKIPLFGVAAVASVLALSTQGGAGAMVDLKQLPLDVRIWNALLAYAAYLWKTLWPFGLAVYYPHRGAGSSIPLALAAALVLAAVSWLALRLGTRKPHLLVGWCWYLGTLLPVIGLVQVGHQAMADRYTYLPLIGIFIMLAWEGATLLEAPRLRRTWLTAAAAALLCALPYVTWVQIGHWRDSTRLFTHAVHATKDNDLAHFHLATLFAAEGRDELAIRHYRRALEIEPKYMLAHYNLGSILARQGHPDEALQHYAAAMWIAADMKTAGEGGVEATKPAVAAETGAAEEHHARALALAREGRIVEAAEGFREALRFDPGSIDVRLNLGTALLIAGRRDEALQEYHEVLRVDPQSASAHYRLAMALMMQRRIDEAVEHLTLAVRADPEHVGAGDLLRAIQERRMHVKRPAGQES